MIYYLRFTDEAEATEKLSKWRGFDDEGNPIWITSSSSHALYVAGVLNIVPSVTKYGEKTFPELSPEISAKVSLAESRLSARPVLEMVETPVEGVLADVVEIPLSVSSDGFHINLICAEEEFPVEALPFIVTPDFPKVIWG